MKTFLTYILFFLLSSNISSADLLKPNTKLKPIEVLKIQLNSLKNNHIPYKDAGIEQTWEFAHPNNKKFTGPLLNFKNMIYSKTYKILLNHISHKIEILMEADTKHIFMVNILTADKKNHYYEWQISKVEDESDLRNCWLTTAVSYPKLKEQGSIAILDQI